MKLVKHSSAFPSIFDDNMFQGFFSPVIHSDFFNKTNRMPAVDVDETENEYTLLAELPGFNKDDIQVSFNEGQLVLKAERDEQSDKKQNGGNMLKERHYGSYYRSFNFGNNIKEQEITAKYEDGVLELVLPKSSKEKQELKNISIK